MKCVTTGDPKPDRAAPIACPDRMIATLAGAQHGLVSRAQLLAAGVTPRMLTRRLAIGRLVRVRPGVYRAGTIPSRGEREAAALYGCRGAVLSHRSAAAPFSLLDRPDVVEVTVTRPTRLAGVRVHRVRRLPPDETTTLENLALTTPARTLLDLAGCLPAAVLERCVAKAEREGLVKSDALAALLVRYPRRPGTSVLRRLIAQEGGAAFTRSEAEARFLALVRSGGLPVPRFNQRLAGYEVDALWPAARLVAEIDGRAWHADARAFERDRLRDSALAAAGYRVMRVTWEQLTRTPNALLVRLTRALVAGGTAGEVDGPGGGADAARPGRTRIRR